MILLTLACTDPGDSKDRPATGDSADSATTDSMVTDSTPTDSTPTDSTSTDPTETAETGDSGTTPADPVGVLVLGGGGTEGALDAPGSWSWDLYTALFEGGDINGDGRITAAVLSVWDEDEWMPAYLVAVGADEAFNLNADTPEAVEAAAVAVAAVDAVFIKGGDQGAYYDAWNGTALEDAILAVHAAGGGIGGTSAGAMSQSEWAIAGSANFDSFQVLGDSRTDAMDDVSDGGTGIHNDFLPLLPDTLVDTHFTERARLGRLAGALAAYYIISPAEARGRARTPENFPG